MRTYQKCEKRDLNSADLCNRKRCSFFFPIVFAAALIGAALIWMLPRDTGAQIQAPSPPRATDKTEYWSKATKMTDIPSKVENGKISIPLDVVKEKRIVRFEYEGTGGKIPLLSYVTQTGKVVTAVSLCEPCRSTKFHIKEKLIVCNSCYTEWNMETLKGIKGGCLKYPPDVLVHSVDNGRILIDEKAVTQWKPRV